MAAVCAVACVYLLVSCLAPRSLGLTAFGDLFQCFLLAAATLAILSNIRAREKNSQLFWTLMSIGCAMWLCAQLMWTYFEVFLHQETPNPFVGDVILFLHLVPMMAALAVLPHVDRDNPSLRLASLDFALLLTWWLYLYLFIVIPWQYVSFSEVIYGRSFDILYGCEQLVLLASIAVLWRRSRGVWRSVYRQFLLGVFLYSGGSILASVAIDSHQYYTGSIYDGPLATAMAWFAAIGMRARGCQWEQASEKLDGSTHALWTARLSMLAVFSTPLMIAWAEFGGNSPSAVRTYRLLLTTVVMVIMGALVFLKQHWMDRELLHLLQLSRENLDEMCKLKDELESKEQSLRWHSLELQRKNLELQEMSFTDALTGIWNRRYLEETLTAEAGQVLRNYERLSGLEVRRADHRDLVFIMVDMDFFKEVNDRHGHAAGDRLLQRVSERLNTVVRKSDVLVRWGGEEFLIMSRSADPAGTPAFCGRILEVMASQPFDLGHGVQVRKTCSVGWAPFPWRRENYDALCAEEVIELADTALYRAKACGRNQGVGILPTEAIVADSTTLALEALQKDSGRLTRVITVLGPELSHGAHAAAGSMTPPFVL
jgi:diguanylate cyclase (GGDEF)-like protein